MRVQEGRELDFIGYRLRDIVYLAEQTKPVNQDDWRGYAESILRIISNQARDAQVALTALSLPNGTCK